MLRKEIQYFFKRLFKIPNKIFLVIEITLFNLIFFINQRIKKIQVLQNKNFLDLGLNRSLGLKKLDNLIKLYPIVKSPMNSEHQVFFSSLSEKNDFNPKNILEIGTFDGVNAFILSKLFPNSKITTIDLESVNEEFTNFYNRNSSNKLEKFILLRNSILKKCSNIHFLEKNSLNLILDNNCYDLIWIDGAHGYPILSIDIANSIRMITKNGYILCDDIYTSSRIKSDNMYRSRAGLETLNALKKANIIDFNLIFKRINYENNSAPSNRKYVAIIKKL